MRSISANLSAAQGVASNQPYVHLTVGPTDYSARVLEVTQTEKPFEGNTKILLRNNDQALSFSDMRGQQVRVGWGYRAAGWVEWSDGPPVWVESYVDRGEAGSEVRELTCIDMWGRIGLDRLASGGLDLQGVITGQLGPGATVQGISSGTRGQIVYSGRIPNSTPARDFISLNRIAGSGFITGERVYNVIGGINSPNYITVSSVSTWGGGPGPGWNGNLTILQILSSLVSHLVPVQWDSDDGIINSMRPVYTIENNASTLGVFKDLLGRTKSYARVGQDGTLHLGSVANNPGVSASYDSLTSSIINLYGRKLQDPTRVSIFNSKATEPGVATTGAVVSDPSAELLQTITRIVDVEVQSSAEANQIAGAILRRAQMETVSGKLLSRMNVGQELWDYISVTDWRAGVSYQGWVGEITRVFKKVEAVYTIEIGLGGMYEGGSGTATSPGGVNYPNPNTPGGGSFAPGVGTLYLDSVLDGPTNYQRVAATDVDANGHVLLASTIQDSGHRTVTDQQLLAIQEAKEFLVDKITKTGLRIQTSTGATRLVSGPGGIQGFFVGVEQVVWDANTGLIHAGSRNVSLGAAGMAVTGYGWVKFDGTAVGVYNSQVVPISQSQAFRVAAGGGVWGVEGLWVSTGRYFGAIDAGFGPTQVWFNTRNSGNNLVDAFFLPYDDGRGYLGRGDRRWGNIYTQSLNFNGVVVSDGDGQIQVDTVIPVRGDQTGDLGFSNYRWREIKAVNVRATGLFSDTLKVDTMNVTFDVVTDGLFANDAYSNRFYLAGVGAFLSRPDGANYQVTIGRINEEIGVIHVVEIKIGRADVSGEYSPGFEGQVSPLRDNKISMGFSSLRFQEFWGVRGYFTDGLYPGLTGNHGEIGNTSVPWGSLTANSIRYKTLTGFHDEDDVGLVQQLHSSLRGDAPAPVIAQQDGYWDHGVVTSLMVGAISQLGDRVKALEGRLS